jgi:hypothetical protein
MAVVRRSEAMSDVRRPETDDIRRMPSVVMPDFKYEFHDLANDFEMIKGQEFENLKADIKEKGILNPIVLYDDGTGLKILDGRNRWTAAKAAGHVFKSPDYKIFTGTLEQAEAFVNSVNTKRRHMTSEMISLYLMKVIQRYPKYNNNQVGLMTGHSHNTVGKARDRLLNPNKIDPKMLKDFEDFKKKFGTKWPEHMKLDFVRYFEPDIRQMLGL